MTNQKPLYKFEKRDFTPFGIGLSNYLDRIDTKDKTVDSEHFRNCLKRTYILGVYNTLVSLASIGGITIAVIKGLELLAK